MIKFVCDTCGKTKRTGQEWILGLAAESIGAQTARKEINILSGWAEPQDNGGALLLRALQGEVHEPTVQRRSSCVGGVFIPCSEHLRNSCGETVSNVIRMHLPARTGENSARSHE